MKNVSPAFPPSRFAFPAWNLQAQAPPAQRPLSAVKASREVVVEDGFKYKRRKSQNTGAGGRASTGAGRTSGHAPPGARRLGSRAAPSKDALESLRSDLPADYPGLKIHEGIPEDLPEEERLQMLVEEICEAECAAERQRLIREFGAADGAAMARALDAAVSEFQLKVEEVVVRGDVQFDVSTTALREMRDAKEEAMRAVATQLEDESAQWRALEAAATSGGATPEEAEAMRVRRRDAEEATEAVRAMLAAESDGAEGVMEPGAVALSVEEAKRKLAMQAEGLNAMVEGVEALCVRAERAAAIFGKAIAEHDFRGLPHVDSPQNLLKSLVASKK